MTARCSARNRRPRLNFGDMRILIGSRLRWKQGPEEVTVSSDRRVRFNGAEMSLTKATERFVDTGTIHASNGPTTVEACPTYTTKHMAPQNYLT